MPSQPHSSANDESKPNSDRRTSFRNSCQSSFTYSIKKVVGQFSGKPQGEGIILDTSTGGVAFQSMCKLGRGSILKIDTHTNGATVTAGATLRILRAEKRGEGYHIAAEFVQA